MALQRTIDQMVDATRRCTNALGASALQRHPDSDLFDYVNRGIAALDRLLKIADTGQRYLASTTLSTINGTELYALPSDFGALISLSGIVNGVQRWLTAYAHNERPALVDVNAGWTGEPLHYRLRGESISLLPVPASTYALTLWYAPAAPTLTTGQAFDTIARLDDFIVWYAAREICKKDSSWELHDRLTADMNALKGEIEAIGRNRDLASPARVIDVTLRDRWGVRRRVYR
jgi:hypothetical protein